LFLVSRAKPFGIFRCAKIGFCFNIQNYCEEIFYICGISQQNVLKKEFINNHLTPFAAVSMP